MNDLYELTQRFIGRRGATAAFDEYLNARGLAWRREHEADGDMVAFVERLLAGSIGAASARAMVASVAKGEMMSLDEVMAILEETSQVIEYSHQLETKSRELEAIASELRAANDRLRELDRLKDDFLSVVSHEFRTPLTSIRSFSEILADNREISEQQRGRFLEIIARESTRLTRLIDDHLDLARMEAGHSEWRIKTVDPRAVIEEAIGATGGVLAEKGAHLELRLADETAVLNVDRDRLMQVLVNLLSNAAKFCDDATPMVEVVGEPRDGGYFVSVRDNGPGDPRRGAGDHLRQVRPRRRGPAQPPDRQRPRPRHLAPGHRVLRRPHLGDLDVRARARPSAPSFRRARRHDRRARRGRQVQIRVMSDAEAADRRPDRTISRKRLRLSGARDVGR